jgi:hypothetical protein
MHSSTPRNLTPVEPGVVNGRLSENGIDYAFRDPAI